MDNRKCGDCVNYTRWAFVLSASGDVVADRTPGCALGHPLTPCEDYRLDEGRIEDRLMLYPLGATITGDDGPISHVELTEGKPPEGE